MYLESSNGRERHSEQTFIYGLAGISMEKQTEPAKQTHHLSDLPPFILASYSVGNRMVTMVPGITCHMQIGLHLKD